MLKNKYIYILIFIIIGCLSSQAQDPQLSQYYSAPVFLSPSNAGSTEGTRATMHFRDQWPAVPGTYITALLTADHYHYATNSGYGIYLMRDYVGNSKFQFTNIGLAYSYYVQLTPKILFVPGISPNFYQQRINYHNIFFADQVDGGEVVNPTLENRDDNFPWNFDVDASALFYSDDFWAGFGISHLMKLNNQFSENYSYLPLKFSMYGGYKFEYATLRNRRMGIKNTIYAIVSYKSQQKINQFDIGAYNKRNNLLFGMWYRATAINQYGYGQDALVFMLGFQKDWFKIGYSYDFTISPLISNTGGAHEISIVFSGDANQKNNKSNKKKRSIACPYML